MKVNSAKSKFTQISLLISFQLFFVSSFCHALTAELSLRRAQIEEERRNIFSQREFLERNISVETRQRWNNQAQFFTCAEESSLGYLGWREKVAPIFSLENNELLPLFANHDQSRMQLQRQENELDRRRFEFEQNKDFINYELEYRNYLDDVDELQSIYVRVYLPIFEQRFRATELLSEMFYELNIKCKNGGTEISADELISSYHENLILSVNQIKGVIMEF